MRKAQEQSTATHDNIMCSYILYIQLHAQTLTNTLDMHCAHKENKWCFFFPILKGLIKGLLHPKIKILSLITYPHVVPNP